MDKHFYSRCHGLKRIYQAVNPVLSIVCLDLGLLLGLLLVNMGLVLCALGNRLLEVLIRLEP